MVEVLNAFRITFALVWLAVGVVLLGRDILLPPELYARFASNTLNWIGAGALVVGSYNILRLYLNWRKRNPRVVANIAPPRAHRTPREFEYNPELDFEKHGEPGK